MEIGKDMFMGYDKWYRDRQKRSIIWNCTEGSVNIDTKMKAVLIADPIGQISWEMLGLHNIKKITNIVGFFNLVQRSKMKNIRNKICALRRINGWLAHFGLPSTRKCIMKSPNGMDPKEIKHKIKKNFLCNGEGWKHEIGIKWAMNRIRWSKGKTPNYRTSLMQMTKWCKEICITDIENIQDT